MTLKDRGTKKWTSFWIPQHVQMVHHMFEEDTYETKPQLDEQELEEINNRLHYALHQGIEVEITYFTHHQKQKITGKIHSIHLLHRTITLDNEERTKLKMDNVLHIRLDN